MARNTPYMPDTTIPNVAVSPEAQKRALLTGMLTAGLGALSSIGRGRGALSNIGTGGLMGLSAYQQSLANAQKAALTQQQMAGMAGVPPKVKYTPQGTVIEYDPLAAAKARYEGVPLGGGESQDGGQVPFGMSPKQRQELAAKRSEEMPQARDRVLGLQTNLSRMQEEARAILDDPNLGWATGVNYLLGEYAPGTPAKDVRARIDTLKSQIAKNVLQEMREASKTGGAVGQVSNFEQQMLMNNLAALDPAQSDEAFRQRLQQVIQYADAAKQRIRNAYEQTYRDTLPAVGPSASQGQGGSQGQIKFLGFE